MTLKLSDAIDFLSMPKLVLRDASWGAKENREGRAEVVQYESRIIAADVLLRGLKFRISVMPSVPNMATFQLDCDQPGDRTRIALYRLEWRPLRAHTNGMSKRIPEDIRGLFIPAGQTHEHTCLENVEAATEQIVKPGVDAARKIDPDFASYDEALAYVCDKLKILNREEIPPSGAQWSLF